MSLTPDKCIELTHRATTDNERMALLLLIAKHSKRDDFDSDAIERLLTSLTYGFLKRLVQSAIKDESYRVLSIIFGKMMLQTESFRVKLKVASS